MMGTFVPFLSKTRETERFLLDGKEIPGVQNVQLGYSLNASPLLYLGNQNINFIPRGTQNGRVSINNWIISNDYFIPFTGNSGCNGYLINSRPPTGTIRKEVRKFYDLNIVGFISGYLSSYNQSCVIGEVPRTQVDFTVFGDIGELDSINHPIVETDWRTKVMTDQLNSRYTISNGYNIDLNIDEINASRIISYDFTINVNRDPKYIPGLKMPVYIQTKSPKEVTFNFQIEIDSYKMDYLTSYPNIQNKQNISLTLKDFETDTTIINYSFDNMLLISTERISNVDNLVTANLTYKGYYI